VIRSFKDSRCKSHHRRQGTERSACRYRQNGTVAELFMIDNAVELDDLRSPPGNRLHPLVEDRQGQYAIWINDQFAPAFDGEMAAQMMSR
jgi:toxin HigB-1